MIKAVIFDMDGVISDTNRPHIETEIELFREKGLNFDYESYKDKYCGMADKEAFEIIIKENHLSTTAEKMFVEKYKRIWSKTKLIKEIPGSKELVKKLKNAGFSLAIASSSPKIFIELVVKQLDIKQYFDALVSTEEVKKGKPNPDIFLLAAQYLKTKPEECVVIEDSFQGVTAAKNAKIKCIGLTKNIDEFKPLTNLVVDSLNKISVDTINNL